MFKMFIWWSHQDSGTYLKFKSGAAIVEKLICKIYANLNTLCFLDYVMHYFLATAIKNIYMYICATLVKRFTIHKSKTFLNNKDLSS